MRRVHITRFLKLDRIFDMLKKIKAKVKSYRKIISLVMQQLLRQAPKVARPTLRQTRLVDGKLMLTGRVLLNFVPTEQCLIVRKFREEKITFDCPMVLTPFKNSSLRQHLVALTGLRWFDFHTMIDVPWGNLPASIYGVAMQFDGQNASFKTLKSATKIVVDDAAQRTYCAFIEPSVRVFRLELYHFGQGVVDGLKNRASQPAPQKLQCVVGEYTNTARDNGRALFECCLLYTSPSPRDKRQSRMPSSA